MGSFDTGLTIGDMLWIGIQAQVRCTRCREHHIIDLAALIAEVGPEYSLWDRRCACRLTAGCAGWNRFYYNRGAVFLPMWDDATWHRWVLQGKHDAEP